MRTEQHETTERITIISGSITAAGDIKKGVGFVVSKFATGVYIFRWTFPVRQVRHIVTTHHSGGTVVHVLVDNNWLAGGFVVRTYTTVPAAVDADFGFMAAVIPQ